MFRRVLIANRGEIVARIMRSCRTLGVETVVVHSEADADAPWVAEAEARVCVGPSAAEHSYLNATAILQAAEQTECQAVHPGYGFLSENAGFAARCRQQGLTFIGPPPAVMRSMGDKASAKRTMRAAGLQTIPGSDGVVGSADEAVALAASIGYPVLLKATAGGGGKGMRRCEDTADVRDGFVEAALEADRAFGDAGLYVEKCLTAARHIEFQVLADTLGAAIHLGERECSIQRQHQKLVEESPSPVLPGTQSDELGRRVAAAVAAIGYVGAGTVEFLRDADGTMYFMEMNTRLQVEHPVTEMRCSIDLVEAQLRIAAGQPLTWRQQDVEPSGHAIELRINAEDPHDGFRPSPGTIVGFDPPATVDGANVRWDSAIAAGSRIPPHYDSLIGKLIVHAADRPSAVEAASRALEGLRIEGVATTAALYPRLLTHPRFLDGSYDVDFMSASGLVDPAGATAHEE